MYDAEVGLKKKKKKFLGPVYGIYMCIVKTP
jgi:hypothetical protein